MSDKSVHTQKNRVLKAARLRRDLTIQQAAMRDADTARIADQELRMLKRQMLAMMQTMQAELTETRLMLGALADRTERMRQNVAILAMGIQTNATMNSRGGDAASTIRGG